jgi:hypothetical protein
MLFHLQQGGFGRKSAGLSSHLGAMVTDSGSTAMVAASSVSISWDTETRDDGGYFSSGAPTIYTVPAGWHFGAWGHVVDLGIADWYLATNIVASGTASGLTSYGPQERAALTTVDQPRCAGALDRFTGGTMLCRGTRDGSSGSGTPTIEANSKFGVARVVSTPVVGAVVQRAAAQSVGTATDQVITFDTELLDDGAMYDAGTPTRLTCPTGGAGWYVFTGHVRWPATVTATVRDLRVLKNGASTDGYAARKTYIAGIVNTTSGSQCVGVEYLADGDYLELYCRQPTGSSVNTSNALLSACRVGITDRGAAVRHAGMAQTVNAGGDVVITFDTEVRDDGAMVDLGTSSSKITAPADGYYAVAASVNLVVAGSTTNSYVFLRVDGTTEIARDGSHSIANGNNMGSNPFAVVYLTAGQYVEVLARLANNGVTGTSANQSRLSMTLLCADA